MDILNLIVVPQLSGGWQCNYSTKTCHAGCANEQSIYSLMSMAWLISPFKMTTNVEACSRNRCCHLANDGASLARQGLTPQ
jgi:hypothetical protein